MSSLEAIEESDSSDTATSSETSQKKQLLDLENDTLKFGFNKFIDCAPIVIAKEKGFFSDEGLQVEVVAQPNWKTLLDNVINREFDGAHMLSGQPIASSIGFGTKTHIITPFTMDLNGNGITVSNSIWEQLQQRVGINRVVALKPKVLLLNEPFGRLDSLTRMDLQKVIIDILNHGQITTMLITHDVAEAIYKSDRVCMMTNGPRAKVAQVLEIQFERPRVRANVLAHDQYYGLRAEMISFLENQDLEKHQLTVSKEVKAPAKVGSKFTAGKV